MDFHGFYTGKIFDAHEYLGAHVSGSGATFRTFAPNAERISVIGEFNGWQEHAMDRVGDRNFWECRIEGAVAGMMYKYRIYGRDGNFIDHCDPYGYGMELRPNTASILRDLGEYSFSDDAWLKSRSTCIDKPLNIYEVHLGSFRRPQAGEAYAAHFREMDSPCAGKNGGAAASEAEGTLQGAASGNAGGPCAGKSGGAAAGKAVHTGEAADWYSYEEMIPILIPYLKENGYNYLEIMPLNEYPCDESWGYQSTGFFCPTARYGTAGQLKAFVDACHREGIGVIMDFVPVHFAVDDYALAHYDGTALYEYPNDAVGVSEWGSCNFMHSRGEVRSFLQSAANFWLTEFHMDGLRMDAISRAIYWQGNPARGVNNNAVDFLKYMNQGLKQLHPTAILSAEDSTSFPGVTKPVPEGGLGFDYKWDMGWMNDTLEYFKMPPEERSAGYHKLTFSMMYYYDDRFLLPLSHDETVHGKATILQKMNGEYAQKFPQARAFYMYMYAHPGKKLNFMGNEIGQLREWDEKKQQDWELLKYPIHESFHRFMMDLNHIYAGHPALYGMDYEEKGFQWLDCHQEEKCVYAFERSGGGDRIACVFNFSGKKQETTLKIPGAKSLSPLLSSDWETYSGSTPGKEAAWEGADGEFLFSLNPFTAVYCAMLPLSK